MDSIDHPEDESDENAEVTAVSDPLRREIIEILRTSGSAVSIADLAVQLARQPDGELDDSDWKRAEELRITLRHRHLPELHHVGLVELDLVEKTVSLDRNATGRDRSIRAE